MTPHVLVTGAGGFLGRHVVAALSAQGVAVRAVATRGDTRSDLAEWHVLPSLTHAPWADLLEGITAVIYLASASTPGSSAGRPTYEVTDHLLPLAELLQALQASPSVHLVYVSSAGSLYSPIDHHPSTESDLIAPRSYHGATKAAAEAFVGAWSAQFGGSATMLRPSNIYGPGQPARRGFGVIPQAFQHMLESTPMDVWGDGSQTRDYIYVDDMVSLCLAASAAPHREGVHVINAASGESTSLNALFEIMERVSGRDLPRIYKPPRAVDATHVAVDPSAALRLYGWRAAVSLEQGIAATWQWFRHRDA